MCRDPRDDMLIELERDAFSVVGNDWNARLDKFFIENLGKYRKYDGRSVQDLMRALRNKVRFVSSMVMYSAKICLHRNITIKTCPTTSNDKLGPCQKASCLTSLGGSLDYSYMFTPSSHLHLYVMSQCSAHTSNSLTNRTQFLYTLDSLDIYCAVSVSLSHCCFS